jgi:hypothetical protein
MLRNLVMSPVEFTNRFTAYLLTSQHHGETWMAFADVLIRDEKQGREALLGSAVGQRPVIPMFSVTRAATSACRLWPPGVSLHLQ